MALFPSHDIEGFAHKDFSPNTFVEVLNEGNTKLLKWTKKVIIEERGYGANVLNKIIETVTQYYIAKGNNATLIKLGNGALEDAVGPKNWKQVQAYMKQEGLNPKQEKDMAKLLAYSNTLMYFFLKICYLSKFIRRWSFPHR